MVSGFSTELFLLILTIGHPILVHTAILFPNSVTQTEPHAHHFALSQGVRYT